MPEVRWQNRTEARKRFPEYVKIIEEERFTIVTINVLGPGCANCKRLAQLVQQVATTNSMPIQLEKVTDYAEIMHWPILSTPGLVVNDTLVASGRIPSAAEVANWLSAAAQ